MFVWGKSNTKIKGSTLFVSSHYMPLAAISCLQSIVFSTPVVMILMFLGVLLPSPPPPLLLPPVVFIPSFDIPTMLF